MEFGNSWGLYGFISLLLLILLYLIKPKPKDIILPSLMFLAEQKGKIKKKSFSKKFVNSIMFLLQFLALAFLAFALTNPSFIMNYDSTSGYTVVIIDVSASMKAFEGTKTRFDDAISIAKNSLKGKTSIILAADKPLLLIESKSTDRAKNILSSLKPKETSTNLGDAIVMAGDLLPDNQGRVIVISDFLNNMGADLLVAKALLENRGVIVDFVKVGNKKNNVGIIDVNIGFYETKAKIRNYNNEEKKVILQIEPEFAEAKEISRTILPNSIESFVFDSIGGVTKLSIPDGDNLPADNYAYVSNPKKKQIKALMITNNENVFLKNALAASGNIVIDKAEPPVVPSVDYDIIILDNYSNDKMLPGTIGDIREKVERGASLIITPQNLMGQIDFEGMLPIIPLALSEDTTITKTVENFFTKDVLFGRAKNYYKASPVNGSITLAESSLDSSPIISMMELGDGFVVYYGIFDGQSDFKNSPGYPIFWNGLINFLRGMEDINNFNFKTGKLLAYDNVKKITGPEGTIEASQLILDKIGLYSIENNIYAVNLFDESESNINLDSEIDTVKGKEYSADIVERKKEINLELYLVLLATAIIFIELLYLKLRGDA